MAATPDTGMEKADMKRLLGVATSEPVNCAVGIGAEPGVGLLMMHKNKGSKILEKELSAKFPNAKATRWGTVFVDQNEGVVKFTINKAVTGLAPRLIKALKGVGHRKVAILLEDGTTLEGAADEEEDADGGATSSATQEPAPSETKATATAEPAGAPAEGHDMAELTKQLAAMIKQLPAAAGADAKHAAVLKGLAVEANTAVKAADAATARSAIEKLEAVLANPPIAGGFVAMQKSRLLWDSARKRVASEIAEFKNKAAAEFAGDPEETIVLDALDRLDEITSTLDDRLIDALDDLLSEQDPVKHAIQLGHTREVLKDYADFVHTNELVKGLEGDTPFGMKLSIGSIMAATVKALQATLH